MSHPANARIRRQIILQLGSTYGNRYVQRVVNEMRNADANERDSSSLSNQKITDTGASSIEIRRDFWSSVRKGADIYFNGADDEGGAFARELMRWRIIGLGRDFDIGLDRLDWTVFMSGRPESKERWPPNSRRSS